MPGLLGKPIDRGPEARANAGGDGGRQRAAEFRTAVPAILEKKDTVLYYIYQYLPVLRVADYMKSIYI